MLVNFMLIVTDTGSKTRARLCRLQTCPVLLALLSFMHNEILYSNMCLRF